MFKSAKRALRCLSLLEPDETSSDISGGGGGGGGGGAAGPPLVALTVNGKIFKIEIGVALSLIFTRVFYIRHYSGNISLPVAALASPPFGFQTRPVV